MTAVNLGQAVYLGGWVTGYGFQPIAIVHSLPQAMFIWVLILLAIQNFDGLSQPFLGIPPCRIPYCSRHDQAPRGMCGHMNGPSPTSEVVYATLPVPTPLLTPAVVGSRTGRESNGLYFLIKTVQYSYCILMYIIS